MASRCKAEYYAVVTGGEKDIPTHWTVKRDPCMTDTFAYAKEKAQRENQKGGKERRAALDKFRAVFDKKTLKEFQPPTGMTPPKFQIGECVYWVRPHVHDLFAAKGVIDGAEWNYVTKKWKYSIAWWERFPKGEQKDPHKQYWLTTRYAPESELYKLEDKARAREALIDTIAKIYTWFAEFYDRLANLKAGDLKPGQKLE